MSAIYAVAPDKHGLLSASLGLSRIHADGHEQLDTGLLAAKAKMEIMA